MAKGATCRACRQRWGLRPRTQSTLCGGVIRDRPGAARRGHISARPRRERSPPSSCIRGGAKQASRLRRGSDRGLRLQFHLAEQADPRNAGIIFYAMSAAENLGEALALLDRYSRVANEAARLKRTATPDGLVVEIGFVGLPRPLGRQGAEFLMAVILRALRELAAAASARSGRCSRMRATPTCRNSLAFLVAPSSSDDDGRRGRV